MSEFLSMGGYGYYVWSAYGLSLVVLVLNAVSARKQMERVRKSLESSAGESS